MKTVALTTILLFALLSCDDDNSSNSSNNNSSNNSNSNNNTADTCDNIASKMRSCDLLPEGLFRCQPPEGENDLCSYNCLMAASCGEITDFMCNQVTENPLVSCINNCPKNMVTCEGGTEVEGKRCNGRGECSDGSDEDGCPLFTCADNSTIPAIHQCNNSPDCPNGEDEEECPDYVELTCP